MMQELVRTRKWIWGGRGGATKCDLGASFVADKTSPIQLCRGAWTGTWADYEYAGKNRLCPFAGTSTEQGLASFCCEIGSLPHPGNDLAERACLYFLAETG